MALAPKVVLVTMFEPEGDALGELTLFRERLKLEPVKLAGVQAPCWQTTDGQLLAVVAGVGSVNTAISIMALGHCPELDLRQSHWLICGIAGGHPNQTQLGDVVIADWAVDGDLAHEIDEREIPDEWATGILPLGASEPYRPGLIEKGLFGQPYQVYRLPEPSRLRAEAQLKPITLESGRRVLTGSVLSAARFWHGWKRNAWAEAWVQHWTQGEGNYLAASMEDTGTLHALTELSQAGKVDRQQLTLIRAISNVTAPTDAISAAESLKREMAAEAGYAGMRLALENGFRCASVVIQACCAS